MQKLFLGTDANDEDTSLHLGAEERLLGTYIVGTTGTGKSNFLKSIIMQDIEAGHGVCVLDPHGDLVTDLMACVPQERLADIILFDPSDIEYPMGLNILTCDRDDPRQRDLVTSAVMDTLYKLFSYSWGPRMEDLLRHSLQTLLYEEDTTFLELLMLLTDPDHRKKLRAVGCERDPILRYYWEMQFGMMESKYNSKTQRYEAPRSQIELVSPALNKIGRFLVNPVIRNIIAQRRSSIDLREVMDEGKILLVNLSKGLIGADNSSFLGSVLVNQILLAALSRQDTAYEERVPFFLYVDEYQNFATESFPQLQSEARKYRIITTVAHQYRDQLDDDNQGSTLNVANLIVFRVSGRDALELSTQFDNTPYEHPPRYEPVMGHIQSGVYVPTATSGSQTPLYREVPGMREPYTDAQMEMANLMAKLPRYQAIVRLQRDKNLSQHRLDTKAFECHRSEDEQAQVIREIREQSRQLARPVSEVEAQIEERTKREHTQYPQEYGTFIPFGVPTQEAQDTTIE